MSRNESHRQRPKRNQRGQRWFPLPPAGVVPIQSSGPASQNKPLGPSPFKRNTPPASATSSEHHNPVKTPSPKILKTTTGIFRSGSSIQSRQARTLVNITCFTYTHNGAILDDSFTNEKYHGQYNPFATTQVSFYHTPLSSPNPPFPSVFAGTTSSTLQMTICRH